MDKIKKGIKEIVPYIIIVVVVLFVKKFIFTPVIVNGDSMMNTLHDKDVMILNKIGMKMNGLDRFDIVVIQTAKSKIIKRVIGLPGETIEYKDNKLYINDKEIKDNYGTYETYDFEKIEIPEGYYFVLGDNRTDSIDSRILGVIKENDILGKTSFTIFPFNRIGNK